MDELEDSGVVGPAKNAKPCPFCGDTHLRLIYVRDGSQVNYCVECGDCACLGPSVSYDSDDEDEEPMTDEQLHKDALDAWNKRI